MTVEASETRLVRVYVTVPGGSGPAQADSTDLRLWVEDTANGERASTDTTFNGKGN